TSTADLLDDVLWRTGELASAGDCTSNMATVAVTVSIATAPATLENSQFGALDVALDDSRSREAPRFDARADLRPRDGIEAHARAEVIGPIDRLAESPDGGSFCLAHMPSQHPWGL